MQQPIQKHVDCVELAGRSNIVGNVVGPLLFKRLIEELIKLPEPGILILDFLRINLVDSSTIMISLAKALAWRWRKAECKTIVCFNTTSSQRSELAVAICNLPHMFDDWDISKKLLLLAVDRGSIDRLDLLGLEQLGERQREIWNLIGEVGSISVAELATHSGIDRKEVLSSLAIFFANCVLLKQESQGQIVVLSFENLLISTLGDIS